MTATSTTIAHTTTTSDTATITATDTQTATNPVATTRAGTPCSHPTGTAGLETLRGTLTMTAAGVSSAQVEVAVQHALRVAFGLCEEDSLSVSADEMQRNGARRLVADLWRVAYEITVPGEKTETVRSTADAIQSNGTYFSLALERAFMENPDTEWSAYPPPQVQSFTELALVMVGSDGEPGAGDGDTRVSGVSSVIFSLSLLLVSATCFVGCIVALALHRKHFMQRILEAQRLQYPKSSRCVVVGTCHTPKMATPRGFHRDVEHIKVKPCPHPSEALVVRDAGDDDIPSIEPSPNAQAEPRSLSKASPPPPLEIHADDAAPTPRPMTTSMGSGLRAVAARGCFGPDHADFLDRPPERQSRGYRNRTISPANLRPTAPSPGGRRATTGRRAAEEEDVFPPAPAKPSSALRRAASRGAKAKPPEAPGLPERTAPALQEAPPPQAAELQLEDINWSPRNLPRENPKAGRQAMECWVEKEVDTDPTASTTSCTPVDAERWSPGAPAFISRGPPAPCERPPARGSPWNARERPQRPGKVIVQCLEEVDCDTLAASPRGPTDHFPKGDVDLASTCAVFRRGGSAEGRGHELCADDAALVATPPSHKESVGSRHQATLPQLLRIPAEEKTGYVSERPLSPEPVVERLRLKEVQLTPRSKKKNPGGRRIVIG